MTQKKRVGTDPTRAIVKTERLILRRFGRADAIHLFALDNDPDVMRYINGGETTPMHVVENVILPVFLYHEEDGSICGFWAAVEKETDHFVGWFSLRTDEDDPTSASLGYRLHKSVWGRGYATEGARALVDGGFSQTGLQRVTATTYERNLASQRVMKKLGMRHIRSFRMGAEDLLKSDTHHVTAPDLWDGVDLEYALTRAEWLASREDAPSSRATASGRSHE